jgi:hypothetical protein
MQSRFTRLTKCRYVRITATNDGQCVLYAKQDSGFQPGCRAVFAPTAKLARQNTGSASGKVVEGKRRKAKKRL